LLLLLLSLLQISLLDDDLGSSTDDLGSVSVPLSSLKPGITTELTLPVAGERATLPARQLLLCSMRCLVNREPFRMPRGATNTA
jgi:Ca2+-dependent lipid-binding protein